MSDDKNNKNKPDLPHFDGEDKSTFKPFSTTSPKAVSNLEKRISETLGKPYPGSQEDAEAKAKLTSTDGCEADIEWWSTLSSWTIREGAFLLSGLDYKQSHLKQRHIVQHFFEVQGDGYLTLKGYGEPWSTIAKNYVTLSRAVGDGELKEISLKQGSFRPMDIVFFAIKKDLPFDVTVAEAVANVAKRQIEFQEALQAKKTEEPKAPMTKTPSDDELNNRLRLIGALADMLKDANVPKESTKTATAIAAYIGETYGIDLPNKGLAQDSVEKVLTLAKKRLKDDGIK